MYLKTFLYLYTLVLKWNPCRNDIGKTVYGGTKSNAFVSDEKVQANRDRVYFKHLYLWFTTHKKLIIDFIYTLSLKW